jgi:hypothetical protein
MGKLSEAMIGDELYFDGKTYEPRRDKFRLSAQLREVQQILADRQWHTLAEMANRTGGSEAGISARIRDLRKARFGQHTIERQHIKDGLWRYRMSS